MTIDLGADEQAQLQVFEDDDPHELAIEFCKAYNLNDNIVALIEENIIHNMNQVLMEQ